MGGMQKHSFYLAKYLAKSRIEVHLFFFKRNEAENPFSVSEMKYIKLHEIEYPPQGKYIGHYLRESYIYSKNIYKVLSKDISKFDFIYSQGFSGWELLNQKNKRNNFPPIAVNFHGIEMFQKSPTFLYFLKSLMLMPFARDLLRKTDVSISLGGKLTGILEKIGANNVVESPIGIEKSWLRVESTVKNNSSRRFLFIGRYERRKGIEELNRVLREIKDDFDFKFVFVGPIPEDKKINDPKIIYHGMVRNEEKIKKICQNCDFLVSPSYAEGMPTVILEAMSSGCAIIASDVGAVSGLVSKKNGYLISSGNHVELKNTIEKAIKLSDKKLSDLKKHSLNHVKNGFTWEIIIERTIEIITNFSKK